MWRFCKSLWSYFGNEDLNLTAAALAYTTVLSIVPFLAVTLAALSYFDALETITPKVESALLENFSGAAGTEGVQLMKKGIKRIQRGRMGSLGAIVLILVSTRMMMGLERAFHRIWQIRNQRPLAKKLFYYWLFLILFPFALALWISLLPSLGPWVDELLPIKHGYAITFVFLFILQKWLPSQPVRAGPALVGSAFSVLLLYGLGKSYKLLSARVFSYGRVYGSFAAVPASLLWIFLVWLVVLWGVALTASLQKKD